jgi:hypothetical protein
MSDDTTLPDYLAENADGSLTITLRRPIAIDGTNVTALKMREPDVNDQLVFDATKGTDVVKELTMIANLCGVSQADVKTLKLHDYKRAQTALSHFIG